MINQATGTIGRVAMDARKVLVLAALAVVAGLSSSGLAPRVQAFDFTAAIEAKLTAGDAAANDIFGFSV